MYHIKHTTRLLPVLCLSLFLSCRKWDGYKKYLGNGETIYAGKMDSVKVYSGFLRVRVTGILPADPNIVKCVISWSGQSGKDSVSFPISKGGTYMVFDTTFEVDEEGTKNFDVTTYDKYGNRSLTVHAVGTVYGPAYSKELSNRPIVSATFSSDGNDAIIQWDFLDLSRGPIGTVIRFLNTSNDTDSVFLPISENRVTLKDYRPNTSIAYRTLYLPDSLSIDTLSCLPDTISIKRRSEVVDSLTGGKARLGVNYNGQFNFINFNNVQRTRTEWVRGFIDFFQFYTHPDQLQDDPRIVDYLQLKGHGYKTILNIKWDFSGKNFPDTSSGEMAGYESFLVRLLDRVWDGTDIIVIGNEPFIESKTTNRGPALVRFYERVAHDVERYEDNKGASGHIPIFLGAFNNLYLASWQTNSVNDLLSFAEHDPAIAGIDLHIHHNDISQINTVLDYVNDKIRNDQRILITEFSLVKYFQSKLNLPIPATFANDYGYDSQLKNYQYIDKALKNQVEQKEWNDFLKSSAWFESRKGYLLNAFNIFKSYYKVAVATYGIRQSYPPGEDFTVNTMPWILNALYANRTAEPDAGGLTPFNYGWIDDFLQVQNQ